MLIVSQHQHASISWNGGHLSIVQITAIMIKTLIIVKLGSIAGET